MLGRLPARLQSVPVAAKLLGRRCEVSTCLLRNRNCGALCELCTRALTSPQLYLVGVLSLEVQQHPCSKQKGYEQPVKLGANMAAHYNFSKTVRLCNAGCRSICVCTSRDATCPTSSKGVVYFTLCPKHVLFRLAIRHFCRWSVPLPHT